MNFELPTVIQQQLQEILTLEQGIRTKLQRINNEYLTTCEKNELDHIQENLEKI